MVSTSGSLYVIGTGELSIDIKANGSDGPVTINTGDTLSLTVSLNAGSSAGQNADWWVAVKTPSSGWYHYTAGVWKPGLIVTYQGPLADVSTVEVLNASGIPAGTYTFYFVVDTTMDGAVTTSTLFYDEVSVTIAGSPLSPPTGFTGSASGSTATISWNAVNGAAGYKFYYGTSSGNYIGSVDLGNGTSRVFPNVPDGTYYLALTAYNNNGESDYSNEVTVTIKNILSPSIEFTYVPPYGSFDDLEGQVLSVEPSDYMVAVYIYVSGWWTKPYWASPLTNIRDDGTWTCDITTGGIDKTATKIIAYLVLNGYNPPLMYGGSSLSAELEDNSVTKVEVTRTP